MLSCIRRNDIVSQKIQQRIIKLRGDFKILSRTEWVQNWEKILPLDFKKMQVNKAGITKVLSHIENISKKSSIQIVNINPGDIIQQEDYKFMSIQLTIRGSIRNVVKFIYQAESSPMLFTVDKLIIEAVFQESQDVKVFLAIKKLII